MDQAETIDASRGSHRGDRTAQVRVRIGASPNSTTDRRHRTRCGCPSERRHVSRQNGETRRTDDDASGARQWRCEADLRTFQAHHPQTAYELLALRASSGSFERVDGATVPLRRNGRRLRRRQLIDVMSFLLFLFFGNRNQTCMTLRRAVGEVLPARVARLHEAIVPRVSLQ